MPIILFIFIFFVVVVSHEFGHFLIARVNGIHVVEFSIGMGPKLFSFGKGDTIYSLRLLPIGGACMFENEDGLAESEGEESPGSFRQAGVWKRIATVFAGPLFNMFLAFLMALIMVPLVWIRDPYVEEVIPDSAAFEAGLQSGDTIISLGGRRLYLYEEISYFNQLNKGKEAELVYERDGVRYTVKVTPKYDEEEDLYMLGVSNKQFFKVTGLDCIRYSWYEVRASVINTYKSLALMITGNVSRKEVSGPVGIADAVGDVYEKTKEAWQDVAVNVMNFILILSVNLGLLNLLPLPALDGGRLVFLFWEAVRGKPVEPQKEGLIHLGGFIFFMLLMVVVFFNDILNLLAK